MARLFKRNHIYRPNDLAYNSNISSSSSIDLKEAAANQMDNNNNNNNNKITRVKECIRQWCEYCTWSGINNMIRTEKKSVFAIWLILYLACITYCVYNCTKLIMFFYNYGVLINMEFKTEMPTDFPAVTVCNLNPIDRTKANTYINQVLNANNLSYVRNTFLIDIDPSTVINLIKSSIISDPNLNYSNRINVKSSSTSN